MRTMFSYFLVFLFGSLCGVSATVKSPIVIVPGILGNQLEGKVNISKDPHWYCPEKFDWETLWLSVLWLIPPFEGCLAKYLTLEYNASTKKYENPKGVETRIPGFGSTNTIEYLDPSFEHEFSDYFNGMVQAFVDRGYERGKTIVGAPYDWRFAPGQWKDSGYYDALKKLVEAAYRNGGNQRVTLIVHSMGAPNALYLLTKLVTQDWKDQYIERLISLSGAWRGAVKSVQAFISGVNEDIIIEKPAWGRESQRSYPSTAFLLPYPSNDTWTKDRVLVSVSTPAGSEKNYTAWDYETLFKDMNYTRGYDMFSEVKDFSGPMIPPNVTVYCFYGTGMDTVSYLKYDSSFPNSQPSITKGDGDGTVNINSLMSCGLWQGRQDHEVHLKSFNNVEHVDMVRQQKVIDEVVAIVTGD